MYAQLFGFSNFIQPKRRLIGIGSLEERGQVTASNNYRQPTFCGSTTAKVNLFTSRFEKPGRSR